MDSSNTEYIKSALIKREIETSPWQAIQELAKAHLVKYYSNLSLEQLRPYIEELGIEMQLNMKSTLSDLAQAVLINANYTETQDYAIKWLETEYEKIADSDLLVLHRLFVNEESLQHTDKANLDILERVS